MIRLADYVMQRILDEGVKHVYYVPGGQCLYLTDALRRNDEITAVAVHHEQSAAMAALTYSLLNENFGACLVTTGCSGTNTLTGLLHAWQDSIPCIFVSGQQNYEQTVTASGLPLRQVGIQEADITSIVKPMTKYAVTVGKAEDIVYHMEKAIYLAKEGRPGPVWIDLPMDVQNAMIDLAKLNTYSAPLTSETCSSEADIGYVADCIKNAKRPVVLAGHGIRSAHALDDFKRFIKESSLPAVFSRFSSDFLPWDDPCNMGIVSGASGASRYGNFAVQNADLVLSIGCRLSIDTTGPERDHFAREARMVVVDIDAVEHQKQGVKIDHFIHMDAGMFLKKMNAVKDIHAPQEWLDKCAHWKKIFTPSFYGTDDKVPMDAVYFMKRLSEIMPKGSVVLSDAGFTGASVPAATKIREGDRMIHSFAQGEMGYTLPGACGAAVLTDQPVVAYTGDGSFMMNIQELQTVVRNHFNIKIVIINNNGYSGVRHGQKAHFRGKSIGTDPGNGIDFPDFGKVASAFGLPYVRIDCPDKIEDSLKQVFAESGPYICEAVCDPEQIVLHNALVCYGKRKFGFRPIEDQSPFIDRETFFEEMIVAPMETSYGKPV